MRTGYRILCTGVTFSPKRQNTLGTVWLPAQQPGDPSPPVTWMKGIQHAVQAAIKKVHLPLGPHREVINKFRVLLERDALDLFSHAV